MVVHIIEHLLLCIRLWYGMSFTCSMQHYIIMCIDGRNLLGKVILDIVILSDTQRMNHVILTL